MRNLLKLLYAYHFPILFVLLEVFAVFLIIQGSNFHHSRFIAFSRSVSGSVYEKMDNISSYLSLKKTNEALAKENSMLRDRLAAFRMAIKESKDSVMDTINNQRFVYYSAKVVNNSVNKQYNYITINIGKKQGIEPEMGVISSDGVVGVIEGVSENFSTVRSLLNIDYKVSAKIKKNNYYGPLQWGGINPAYCVLHDILHHVHFSEGDTIVTTGYAGVYPEGVMIGTISDSKLVGGNSYDIRVKLSNDFRSLTYVMVIKDLMKKEQTELEKKDNND